MGERAISLGGTCTGEHGVGSGKKHLLKLELGEGSIGLMKRIKNVIDPMGVMNPGKVLDMDEKEKVAKKDCSSCKKHSK